MIERHCRPPSSSSWTMAGRSTYADQKLERIMLDRMELNSLHGMRKCAELVEERGERLGGKEKADRYLDTTLELELPSPS